MMTHGAEKIEKNAKYHVDERCKEMLDPRGIIGLHQK